MMDVGVLGTGIVGSAIGGRLVVLGHEVMMGSRSRDNPAAADWSAAAGPRASHGTFAEAAQFGAMLFNCTAGARSLEALATVDPAHVEGKILVDVANPLDFSGGFPPSLTVCNTDSLGEQIQRALPGARVVKSLNTVNCDVMVDPARVPGTHHVFVSGDDAGAKDTVTRLLHDFGWPIGTVIDLGDITTARGPEMWLALWVRLYATLGHGEFNLAVVR